MKVGKNKADPNKPVEDIVSEQTPFPISKDGIKALLDVNESDRRKVTAIAEMNLLEENYILDSKGEAPRMEMDGRDIIRADIEKDLHPDFDSDDASDIDMEIIEDEEPDDLQSEEDDHQDPEEEYEDDEATEDNNSVEQ